MLGRLPYCEASLTQNLDFLSSNGRILHKGGSLAGSMRNTVPRLLTSGFQLHAKKGKKGGSKQQYSTSNPKSSEPTKAQRQGRDDRLDAHSRKFMFTIIDLTKTLPDGSRTILNNINLSFYPGAKIGVVGSNGSGKSSLLRIMAGVDKQFDGTAIPMPSASIGYLPQEPELTGETVMDNINLGVQRSQQKLDRFNELSVQLGEPLSDQEMSAVMNEIEELQNEIDAGRPALRPSVMIDYIESIELVPYNCELPLMWSLSTQFVI